MADKTDDRSLGDLFSELSQETSLLVKKEVELATTEMTAKLKKTASHAKAIAAGGALAHAGLLLLLAGVVLGLAAMGMPAWLAAVVVGIAVLVISYALVTHGVARLKATSFAPNRTMDSVKEAATWTSRTHA